MKIRKHFRTDTSIVNYIISDLNLNKMNRQDCIDKCVAERVCKLNQKYDKELDKILTDVILTCQFDDLPIQCISKITVSLTKIVNVLNKGFLSLMGDK